MYSSDTDSPIATPEHFTAHDVNELLEQKFNFSADYWRGRLGQLLADAIDRQDFALIKALTFVSPDKQPRNYDLFSKFLQYKLEETTIHAQIHFVQAQIDYIDEVLKSSLPSNAFDYRAEDTASYTCMQFSNEELRPCALFIKSKFDAGDGPSTEGVSDITLLRELLPKNVSHAYIIDQDNLYYFQFERSSAKKINISRGIHRELCVKFQLAHLPTNPGQLISKELTAEDLSFITEVTHHQVVLPLSDSMSFVKILNEHLSAYPSSPVLRSLTLFGLRCAINSFRQDILAFERGVYFWEGRPVNVKEKDPHTKRFLRYFETKILLEGLQPLISSAFLLEDSPLRRTTVATDEGEMTVRSIPRITSINDLQLKRRELATRLQTLKTHLGCIVDLTTSANGEMNEVLDVTSFQHASAQKLQEVFLIDFFTQQKVLAAQPAVELTGELEGRFQELLAAVLDEPFDWNAPVCQGVTPLQWAVISGQLDIAIQLAHQDGVDISALGSGGENILTLRSPLGDTLYDYLRRIVGSEDEFEIEKSFNKVSLSRLMQTLAAHSIDTILTGMLFNTHGEEWYENVRLLMNQQDMAANPRPDVQAHIELKKKHDLLHIRKLVYSVLVNLIKEQRLKFRAIQKQYSPNDKIKPDGVPSPSLRVIQKTLVAIAEESFERIQRKLYPATSNTMYEHHEIWLYDDLYNLNDAEQRDAFFRGLRRMLVSLQVSNALPRLDALPKNTTLWDWDMLLKDKLSQLESELEVITTEMAETGASLQEAEDSLKRSLGDDVDDSSIPSVRETAMWLTEKRLFAEFLSEKREHGLPDFPGLHLTYEQKLAVYTHWRYDINRQNDAGETLLHLVMRYQHPGANYHEKEAKRRELVRFLVTGHRNCDFRLGVEIAPNKPMINALMLTATSAATYEEAKMAERAERQGGFVGAVGLLQDSYAKTRITMTADEASANPTAIDGEEDNLVMAEEAAPSEASMTTSEPQEFGRTLLHYLHECGEIDLMMNIILKCPHFNKTSAPPLGQPILTVTNLDGTPLLNQFIMQDNARYVRTLLACQVPVNDMVNEQCDYYLMTRFPTASELETLRQDSESNFIYIQIDTTVYFQRWDGERQKVINLDKRQAWQVRKVIESVSGTIPDDSGIIWPDILSHFKLERFRKIIGHPVSDASCVSVWSAIKTLPSAERMLYYIQLVRAALFGKSPVIWAPVRKESCSTLASYSDECRTEYEWTENLSQTKLIGALYRFLLGEKKLASIDDARGELRELVVCLIKAHEEQMDFHLIWEMEHWTEREEHICTKLAEARAEGKEIVKRAARELGFAQNEHGRMDTKMTHEYIEKLINEERRDAAFIEARRRGDEEHYRDEERRRGDDHGRGGRRDDSEYGSGSEQHGHRGGAAPHDSPTDTQPVVGSIKFQLAEERKARQKDRAERDILLKRIQELEGTQIGGVDGVHVSSNPEAGGDKVDTENAFELDSAQSTHKEQEGKNSRFFKR
ncbi:MAG: hypothetical protein CMF50_06915 [Legionellales bacterium]|nr:hypothetical protein [Legionellales bacterium]|tara:strand:+ start:7416 stop:11873 length:4458 start_codon:yes stop_codon:yes gene_type:complete